MMGAMEGLNSALLNHYGGNHGGGNWLPEVVVYGHQDEMPPYSITDLNNDGVSEMIVLENSPNNFRKCHLITTDLIISAEGFTKEGLPIVY